MKNTIAVAGLAILVGGCVSSFVGNSPMERKHRKYIQQDESTFVNQSYQRRYAPAIQETEAYFTFTNRLSKRDVEPMDLANLGKVTVLFHGTNTAWQIVTTAFVDYSNGAQLSQATNVMWLVNQSSRVRDTAWLVAFPGEWLKEVLQ